MNHLPYKEWLLSEASLSDEQNKALQEHLRSCEACRQIAPAWTDVQVLFKKIQPAQPLPGFTMRWQTRLEKHRLQKQRKLAWFILAIIAGIAAVLVTLIGVQYIEIVNSPGNLILLWISRLTGVLSIYWTFENFVNSLAAYMPSLSWLLLIFGIGFISFMNVLWLAAYRKLTIIRRLV